MPEPAIDPWCALSGYSLSNDSYENNDAIRVGTCCATGAPVVVKRLDITTPDKRKIAERECRVISKLDSPFVVRLLAQVETDASLFLVMPRAQSGDLLQFILHAEDNRLDEATAKRIFVQLVLALDHMHRNRWLHRDVKPDNIFLDAANNVQLGDFGLSLQFIPDSPLFPAHAGTIYYAAPEAFTHEFIYGPELDIWSAGVALYVMLRGRYPFWGKCEKRVASAIMLNDPNYHDIPCDAADLLVKMFVKSPKRRISMERLKNHPYIRNEVRHWASVQRSLADPAAAVAAAAAAAAAAAVPQANAPILQALEFTHPANAAAVPRAGTNTAALLQYQPADATAPLVASAPAGNRCSRTYSRSDLLRLHNKYRTSIDLLNLQSSN